MSVVIGKTLTAKGPMFWFSLELICGSKEKTIKFYRRVIKGPSQ
jgi:hypothetical protein